MGIKINSQNTPPDHAVTVPPSTETVPDNTCNGQCSGCGECCLRMTLRLTNKEIKTIRKYIKEHNIKPQHHSPTDVPDDVLAQSAFVDTICPFLDASAPQGHNCTIYPVRPIICRTYTCKMYHDNGAAKQVYDDVIKLCHGEHAAYTLLTSPERNLQQLFFPKEYTPQPCDIVIINDVYADGYEKYKGAIFIMTALERKTTNGPKEVGITRADTPSTELIWYPIDGLTIIKLPERM